MKTWRPSMTLSLRNALALAACVVLATTMLSAVYAAQLSPPHIVILLADDLGWGDVGYHGSRIHTPNIDNLAKNGTRLNQFYVQPVCSPTRGALLTGRYPMRLGLQCGVVRPWAQHGLSLDERTLPTALKEIGYQTAIVGKWHLGHSQPEFLPLQRGFDQQYGHYNGALDYFTHIRDGGFDWHQNDTRNDDEGYATELIAAEAVRVIAEHDEPVVEGEVDRRRLNHAFVERLDDDASVGDFLFDRAVRKNHKVTLPAGQSRGVTGNSSGGSGVLLLM